MHDGKGEKIRLYGVDCPEKAQDFGQKAKQFCSDMVFGKTVDVESVVTDRYGRTVGIVRINGKCLNEELLRNGFAWQYKQYCDKSFCSEWKKLEEQARSSKAGLWSQPNPTAPLDFRHGGKGRNSQPAMLSSGDFHGNVSTHVFHSSTCKAYNCKNCTEVFKNREDAIKAGYKPCGSCRP